MSRLIIRGGLVIDAAQGLEDVRTVVIDAGRIASVSSGNVPGEPGVNEIDARGLWVSPGFVDLHVHLREPGEEHKETFVTGGAAAVAGGFTTLVAMGNTQPPPDSPSRVAAVRERAKQSLARVFTVGTVSVGLLGESLTDARALADAGVVALSDDGRPIAHPGLMRRALEQALTAGLPLLAHEEEAGLVGKGCMHEGPTATRLGLPGVPPQAEELMVRRDLALVELTGARLHLQHLSTEGALRAVREAKARGLPVTAEAAPHHFTLVDADVGDYDTNAKMNPPLRSIADRAAVRAALADGTLDAIATDHAPHAFGDKATVFEAAANGIIGLETALSLGLQLVQSGLLTRRRLFELMTIGPARVLPALGAFGTLAVGAPADVVLVDPERSWRPSADGLRSKSKNSPWLGTELRGQAVLTFVDGVIAFDGRS